MRLDGLVEHVQLGARGPDDLVAAENSPPVAQWRSIGPMLEHLAVLRINPPQRVTAGQQVTVSHTQQVHGVLWQVALPQQLAATGFEREHRLAIRGRHEQRAAIIDAGIQVAIEVRRAAILAVGTRLFGARIKRGPLQASIARRDGGHGAEIRVAVKRALLERQQVVRDLFSLPAARRLGRADHRSPTALPRFDVVTRHVYLRPHVTFTHRHVNIRSIDQGRTLEGPLFIVDRGLLARLRNGPNQPSLGCQVQTHKVSAGATIERFEGPACDLRAHASK